MSVAENTNRTFSLHLMPPLCVATMIVSSVRVPLLPCTESLRGDHSHLALEAVLNRPFVFDIDELPWSKERLKTATLLRS